MSTTPVKDDNAIDTLSEAGTYTLEVDDPRRTFDVEEARKMIDNVFGVAKNQQVYGNLRNIEVGSSVPSTPKMSRRAAVKSVGRRSGTEDSNCSESTAESDLRQRTFTRSKSGRRGSVEDHSPTFDTSQFDQVYHQRYNQSQNASRSSSKVPQSPKMQVRNRLNSCSSSKSGGSNRTVEVKNPSVIKGSPLLQSRRLPSSDSDGDSDHTRAKSDVDQTPSSSGLKFNRAFALKRAMLGLDTRGVNISLTDDKVQKNLEKRASDPRNKVDLSKTSFNRDDGGRFSLRANNRSSGKPPTCPSTPTRKARVSSSKVESLKLSPASSTTSIPSTSYQRSSSFGPNQHQSNSGQHQTSDRLMRGMSSFSKRMFSVKPHHQQQQQTNSSSRQQANVVPIKRQQTPNESPMTTSVMSSSLHEEITNIARPSTTTTTTTTTSPPSTSGRRTLSSLDNLVVSAILQLSVKIRRGMREWLEQEKLKHASGSETRLMIDEILPQVSNIEGSVSSVFDGSNENLSKDLSNILKNLKKVEQSMEGQYAFEQTTHFGFLKRKETNNSKLTILLVSLLSFSYQQ
jgi:hypothetical protein